MDVPAFFLVQHARLHGVDVGDPGSTWDRMLGGLADDDRRRRSKGMNSLAWILWHVARAEVVVVTIVVTSAA